MISQRSRGFYDLMVGLQLCLVLAGFWAHFLVIEWCYSPVAAKGPYLVYCFLVLVGVFLEALSGTGRLGDWSRTSYADQHRVAVRQTIFAAVLVLFFLVASKDVVISRLFLFSWLPVLYVVLLVSGRFLPRWMARWIVKRGRKVRTLLVGSKRRVEALHGWLKRREQLGLEVVGVLCDEKVATVDGLRVLGRVDDLSRIVEADQINQVVVVELPSFSVFLSKLADQCESLGARLLVMSDLEEKFRHQVVYMEHDGKHFFGLRQEPLENPLNRALKRLVDLTVAIPVVLFILPPVSLLVWLLQRRQSPGPLFYTQDRRGFQNRPFNIIKYRTMHVSAGDPTRQAIRNDVRVYRGGVWLRKLSLDELPQFLNVLSGEMSVIGPRPHLREHDQSFAKVLQNYPVRSFVKPGISGLAQVRGLRGEVRDEAKLRERIESDICYLENWSLGVDLMIMARTAWQILFPPKTAY